MQNFFSLIEGEKDKISGLSYYPNFISSEEEMDILCRLDSEPWINDLKRRVQHYGYRYNYKSRKVSEASYLGPLPEWATILAERLFHEKYFEKIPDQIIVNEYLPGQGISAHVDCVPCFGKTIASLSLGSTCIMKLSKDNFKIKNSYFLERCSLLVLSGEARYEWTHSIPSRKSDSFEGEVFYRSRRVSLTFRTINLI